MHNPSPFDMIRKASNQSNMSDRWAVLLNNTQERIPIDKETPPAKQAVQHHESQEHESTPYPQLMDPPFSPPQARHPMLDEIAQRHTKAIKNARKSQEWVLHQATEMPKNQTISEAKE